MVVDVILTDTLFCRLDYSAINAILSIAVFLLTVVNSKMAGRHFACIYGNTQILNRMVRKFLVLAAVAVVALVSCETDKFEPVEGNDSTANGGNSSGSNSSNVPGVGSSLGSVSTWHWGSESDTNGINFIVVDEAKAERTVDSYIANKIKRVYGGYSRIPAHPTQKVNLASWNRRLNSAGIKSIYLIGNAQWIYPENRQAMLDYIQTYYVNFNKSVEADATLKGLHVDIEPHQLNEWSTASLQRKKELLFLLKDTYRDLRNHLSSNGMGADEIMADIPSWFDEMSAIGWSSKSERDAWFADAMQFINGFSIMAYEVNSVSSIVSMGSWERSNVKGMVETGINADEIGSVWKSKSEFVSALEQIGSQTKASTAIHNYATFMGL